MFHVGGIGPLTSAVATGATFISAPHFDADAALEQVVDRARCTSSRRSRRSRWASCAPRGYRRSGLGAVRTMLNVAPPETEELIQSMLPGHAVLLNDFGMTEAAGMVTFTPVTDPERLRFHTNGLPFPGLELRITADDGHTALPMRRGRARSSSGDRTRCSGYLE